MRRLLVSTLAVLAVVGAAASDGRTSASTSARARGAWIVLGSDRDGPTRAYSVRPDGSRLTPLLGPGRALVPRQVSGDGGTVLYAGMGGRTWFVSRADGTGLHRVADGEVWILSRDGRLVAFEQSGAVWVAGTNGRGLRRVAAEKNLVEADWSPDGKALAFVTSSDDGMTLIVQRLGGGRRVLVRGAKWDIIGSPRWSPDGRSIAYSDDDAVGDALWIIRPDGSHRRRVVRGDSHPFAWSPDGTRIAFASGGGIALVRPDGRGLQRLPARFPKGITELSWSPDGRRLAVESGWEGDLPSSQIFVVGADGRGRRLVTHPGQNSLVGWTRLAPTRPPAGPPLPSERVLGARSVATNTPIADLSADGSRVAFAVGPSSADCDHVVVWKPGTKALVRFGRPAPCGPGHDDGQIYDVELGGSRVAWSSFTGCGNTVCGLLLSTATLARRSPVGVADGGADAHNDFHVHGDGGLLVFDDGSRLERIGAGRKVCSENGDPDNSGDIVSPRMCTTLRSGAHAAEVDSVSGRLIAVREPDAVSVLDDLGKLVRVFPFGAGEVDRAVLDGDRLVVVTRGGVLEVYDVATGAALFQRPLPSGYRLTDVDGGVAVLVRGRTIELLRLSDAHSSTLRPGRGPVSAELEPPGLYYSYTTPDGGGRVAFMPRSEVLQKLAGSAR